MDRFNNKQFVITGGSGGIGRATALRIAQEGGRVLVTGTNSDKLKSVAEHANIIAVVDDAGSPAAGKRLGELVAEKMSHVDGVFLNAGFGIFTPHTEVTAEQYDHQYAVNVRGPILQARYLSPLIRDGGTLLMNTSVAQNLGLDGGIIYNSTKGSLRTVVRVLAKELSGRQVRVNAVSPGPIGTDFFDRTGTPQEQVQQMAEMIQAQVPLGRFGTSEEVAAVACFLLSDEASFVTGSEYVVDGGMTQI